MAKKVDMAALAAKLADLNKPRGGNAGMDFLNIQDGRNVIRILPARDDADWFYEETFVHYGVGKSESDKKGTMVVCPTTKNEKARCPVCELSKELRKLSKKEGDSYDKQAREIGRKKRVYYNAIDRSEDLSIYEKQGEGDQAKWMNTKDNKPGSPVKVFASGIGVFKDIIKKITDPEFGDITDPEEGLDVILTKSGTGFNTEYDVSTVRRESPIGFDQWEECLHDLKQLAQVKTYDEIMTIMTGDEGTDSGDKDGDEDSEGDNGTPETPVTDNGSDAEQDETQDEIMKALQARRGNRNK